MLKYNALYASIIKKRQTGESMMNEQEQQTLNDLQLPTISLVEKFCNTSPEVKAYFAGMLAVYENTPTPDTINKINEVVKSRASREEKKQWLIEELKPVPSSVITEVQRKYIDTKAPAPTGLPRSGELMTFLDYVPRDVKDSLMEAQAAARILHHIDNGKSDLKSTLISKDENGEVKEQKEYLNKPFATTIQRVEQLTEFLSSYKVNEEDMLHSKKHEDMLSGKETTPTPAVDIALAECKKLALETLKKSANVISESYPQAAQRISSLATAYGADESAEKTNINLITQVTREAAEISTAYYGTEFVASDQGVKHGEHSFNKEEKEAFNSVINKRTNQIYPQVNSNINIGAER